MQSSPYFFASWLSLLVLSQLFLNFPNNDFFKKFTNQELTRFQLLTCLERLVSLSISLGFTVFSLAGGGREGGSLQSHKGQTSPSSTCISHWLWLVFLFRILSRGYWLCWIMEICQNRAPYMLQNQAAMLLRLTSVLVVEGKVTWRESSR